MTDRYDFMTVVDDIFKESTSTEDMCNRYAQLKKDLDSIFQQNLKLRQVMTSDNQRTQFR